MEADLQIISYPLCQLPFQKPR